MSCCGCRLLWPKNRGRVGLGPQQVAVVEDGGLHAERAMNSAHSVVGDGMRSYKTSKITLGCGDPGLRFGGGPIPGAGVQTGPEIGSPISPGLSKWKGSSSNNFFYLILVR